MRFDEVLRTRRSVRGFLPREVEQDLIEEMFSLAQCAPSNCNLQLWLPHVVSGDALRRMRASLVSAAEARIPTDPDWPADGRHKGAYRDRQYDAAAKLYGAMGIERHDLAAREAAYIRNQAFFDAPHVVFLFMQQPFDTREAMDVGIYAQSLMLVMTSRGVSSCAQGALSLYPAIVRTNLGLPHDHRLLLGISFGYEDVAVPANGARTGRVPMNEAVVFHRD